MKIITRAAQVLMAASVLALNACASAQASGELTQQQAQLLVEKLYDALNEPAKKDVEMLVKSSTTPDWLSCGGNDRDCVGQSAVIAGFKRRGIVIPDLKWRVSSVLVAGNTVTVRGEASGTPALEFLGVKPGGKSFKMLYISVHTIRGGKINHTYHVEDYAGALRQLSAN